MDFNDILDNFDFNIDYEPTIEHSTSDKSISQDDIIKYKITGKIATDNVVNEFISVAIGYLESKLDMLTNEQSIIKTKSAIHEYGQLKKIINRRIEDYEDTLSGLE